MAISSPSQTPRRQSSTLHYQTFNTPPPKHRGLPPSQDSTPSRNGSCNQQDGEASDLDSPLPKKQMAVLAVIALCEQTALNSIGPYMPQMAASFPGVSEDQVGMYIGIIASAFAIAQFTTNFFWGWLSDYIGRKPVILTGTILTAACFVAFGFCRTLWQAVVVQAIMGAVNGNPGVVPTCLGEITDRTNRSKAFIYLPVLYGIGTITGPLVGGLLVSSDTSSESGLRSQYPYLPPNLLSAAVLLVEFIVTAIWLEESLEEATVLPRLEQRVKDLFSWIWQFTSSSRPTYVRGHSTASQVPRRATADDDSSDADSEGSQPLLANLGEREALIRDEILNRDTLLLLISYLLFSFSNVSFTALYPIFGEAPEPIGRGLSPREIGISMAFAGITTILFQVFVFGKLRDKMGNRWSYRAGHLGFVISLMLMPFVGYKGDDSKHLSGKSIWLAIEVCFILLIKTVATVIGLTSALLLITNSAPNHFVLGALNGLAQALSAAGRALGPFLSGSLFSLATKVRPKGEALAFGVFACISLIGFIMSLGIRSPKLDEDGDLDSKSDDEEDEEDSP